MVVGASRVNTAREYLHFFVDFIPSLELFLPQKKDRFRRGAVCLAP